MASPASANVVSPGAPCHFGLVYFDDRSPNMAFVYLDVSPYKLGCSGLSRDRGDRSRQL